MVRKAKHKTKKSNGKEANKKVQQRTKSVHFASIYHYTFVMLDHFNGFLMQLHSVWRKRRVKRAVALFLVSPPNVVCWFLHSIYLARSICLFDFLSTISHTSFSLSFSFARILYLTHTLFFSFTHQTLQRKKNRSIDIATAIQHSEWNTKWERNENEDNKYWRSKCNEMQSDNRVHSDRWRATSNFSLHSPISILNGFEYLLKSINIPVSKCIFALFPFHFAFSFSLSLSFASPPRNFCVCIRLNVSSLGVKFFVRSTLSCLALSTRLFSIFFPPCQQFSLSIWVSVFVCACLECAFFLFFSSGTFYFSCKMLTFWCSAKINVKTTTALDVFVCLCAASDMLKEQDRKTHT